MAEPAENEKERDYFPDTESTGLLKSQVVLKGRYRISYRHPLPSLDMPSAKAYHAEDQQVPDHKIYALVCRTDLPIRYSALAALRGLKSEGLLPLVDSGVVEAPMFDAKTMVLIYERPLGGRVIDSRPPNSRILPVEEAEFIQRWARPLLLGISDLSVKGLTHRAIRPDNLYYMDVEKTRVVLGDCLSSPPAYDQPDVFETIESGMCMPEGRGAGSTSDDMYSFGATLVYLSLGHHPLSGMSAEERMDLKIKKGSYAALIGEERISLSLIELLRGLLLDNAEQRWNISSVEMWMDGRRMTPIQSRTVKNSQRPFLFNDVEYFSYRELALAFARHWDMASDAVRSEKLLIWVKRGFEDQTAADEIVKTINSATANFSIRERQDDYLVARACMVLDRRAPLRMRSWCFMPEALGTVIATAMMQNRDVKPLIGIITTGYLESWYELQHDKVSRQSVRSLQMILQNPDLGMGMERCLYELNEGLPCQSPMIVKEYIDDIRGLLPALDAVSKKADPQSWPLDRHITAFIAAKFGTKVTEPLTAINRPKASVATGGMLNLLAMLQWTFGQEKLYSLCRWVGGLAAPIIESYHNREKQRQMEKDLPKYVRRGNLADLYRFLDNREERVADENGFLEAKQEYAEVVAQIEYLDGNREDREEYGLLLGNQIASMISFSIALLTMFLLLLTSFMR